VPAWKAGGRLQGRGEARRGPGRAEAGERSRVALRGRRRKIVAREERRQRRFRRVEDRPGLELQHAQRTGGLKLDSGLLDMDRIARMAGAAVDRRADRRIAVPRGENLVGHDGAEKKRQPERRGEQGAPRCRDQGRWAGRAS
jgi:hypothetical protein